MVVCSHVSRAVPRGFHLGSDAPNKRHVCRLTSIAATTLPWRNMRRTPPAVTLAHGEASMMLGKQWKTDASFCLNTGGWYCLEKWQSSENDDLSRDNSVPGGAICSDKSR